MSFAGSLAVNFGRVATFIQVLFYLPLALDIAGQDAFLALSASLASYYLFLSTVRLLTRATRLAWIGQTLAVFQFIVIPACLLVCFNVYSPPSATIFPPRRSDSHENTPTEAITSLFSRRLGSSPLDAPDPLDNDDLQSLTHSAFLDTVVSASVSVFFWLARRVPGWWHTLLRISSPFFSLLEGVASLLVIQSLASTSRWIIASSLAIPSPRYQPSSSPTTTSAKSAAWMSNTFLMRTLASIGFGASEVWQIFFLLVSATIYVTAAFALYVSFPGATNNRPATAAAIATSVTSTLWLTAIAFAIRKGNVIETSLMFAYVVFNIYQLGPSLSFTPDPISLIRSFKVNTHGKAFVERMPLALQRRLLTGRVMQGMSGGVEVIAHWLAQSVDFIHAAGAALPKSVIVSLIYRLMVLYAASRILPMLKGSVVPQRHNDAQAPRRRSSRGRARSSADATESDSSKWSSSSSTSSSSSVSGTEVEELKEEVWDQDQGQWILQRRRLRRRTRRRTSLDGGINGGSESEYSEDDSGIAYNKEEKATRELADGLKEPSEESQVKTTSLGDPTESRSSRPSSSAAARAKRGDSARAGGGGKRSARRGKLGRRESLATQSAKIHTTPSEKRRHKRPRPRPPSSSSSSSSSSSTPLPLASDSPFEIQTAQVQGQGQGEAFGSFISIVVSYSRLILIAVYSHLLLLDQANQVYWRFLTVGLTLFLWGLEIVISKEEEGVGVGGVGELGAAAGSRA
ncbi:related to ICE2 - integral ER membrane protein with type-III transmembrane domains [Melanopsichium pennsylvanicum]|uniref:Related to ICE2 - integral ER membrane protein with type-III transmembrane domains n=2 Tax=Melanopsichium pennsylvanicum TaxID=63383 RepID=A0AAJ4XG34_9BASI|nr:conserved hypothetical protein [Melanopsichium pennsylvanicum 4]SNX81370.1 related to ICE2 - integral ER membrane protein with type-III transmembrane domains [Melanopsichium pennsylvanicum]